MSRKNPIHILDEPTEPEQRNEELIQPPTKKPKIEPGTTPARPMAPPHKPSPVSQPGQPGHPSGPSQQQPKPSTPAKPTSLHYPVIDILPKAASFGQGDLVIKISLPTNGTSPAKVFLLRLYAVHLIPYSEYFQNLCGPNYQVAPKFTLAKPWELPEDWDAAAFLDLCVMLGGEGYGIGPIGDALGQSNIAGQGAGRGFDKERMSRFPRIVAMAEQLGCAATMMRHCCMPLWRFFGPTGEADEPGLQAKGLDVL
jgi:hypothetical protein